METKWYCFLFWFSYRFTLACLAHFNWCMSIYTNCVYFTLWKSYDLLWFWMHLILCSCFPQLRPENYLIVWSNLIIKKLTKYPDYTFKQLYYALYTSNRSAHFTKRLMSRKEKKGVIELDSNSDEDEKNEPTTSRSAANVDPEAPIPLRTINPERSAKAIPTPVVQIAEVEEDDADENDEHNATETTPLRPPRPSRPKFEEPEEDDDEVIEVVTDAVAEDESPKESPTSEKKDSPTSEQPKWKSYVPNSVMKFLPRQESSTPSVQSKASTNKDMSKEVNNKDGTNSTSAIGRFYDRIKFNRTNSNSSTNTSRPNEIEILRPDYSNRYDCHDKSKQESQEKRDRKALRHRIRHELRMAMKADAAKERDRKKVTDAIELLLQLLRMMSSFAMLIGTIRKTFIPASFKYLKPGQHAYDNYELIILFRCTAFLDIAMFWMNVTYAYCLQWQLCCRLGFTRFVFWAMILGVVSTTVMFIPMTYVMNDLDLSWCRLMPNTTFAKYQPSW